MSDRDIQALRLLLPVLLDLGASGIQSSITSTTIRVSWSWQGASWCLDASGVGVVCWRGDERIVASPAPTDVRDAAEFWTGPGWESDPESTRWRGALREVLGPVVDVSEVSRLLVVFAAAVLIQRDRDRAAAAAKLREVDDAIYTLRRRIHHNKYGGSP